MTERTQRPSITARFLAPFGLSALALLLSACDGSQSEQGDSIRVELPVESSQPADPSATASILREEVAAESAIEIAPNSLEVTMTLASASEFSEQNLNTLKEALASDAMKAGWPITIAGHSDSSGSEEVNIEASQKRANAVAAWLVEQGVSRARITTIAFGEQNPILPNANPDGSPYEAGREGNRRVELQIVQPDKREEEEAT